MKLLQKKNVTVIYEHELAIIAPNDIHMLKINEKEVLF